MSASSSRRLSLMTVIAVLAAGVGVAAVAAPASAATLTVTSSADSGAGSLRDVLAGAAAGDTIVFDPSVTSIAVASSIPVPVGVTIDGPGSGVLTISRANGDNFVLLNLEPDIVNQDFTIEGIRFDGTGGGTGVMIYAGLAGEEEVRDVTLRDIRVTNALGALGSGFATYQMAGDLLIEDSSFEDGAAVDSGGALSLEQFGGTATIRNSTFDGNSAPNLGGAIYHSSPTSDVNNILIEDCTFIGNSADEGGAVYVATIPNGTGTEIISSTFQGNTAVDFGGAIAVAVQLGGFSVDSSTFTGNSASDGGTSIYLQSASGQAGIQSSTIDEALGAFAAIYIASLDGGFGIQHSTIVAASALLVANNTEDLLGVENSILDVTDAAAIVVSNGGPADASYTAFSTTGASDDIVDGVGNLFSVDPLLATLADNGGPTFTRLPAAGSPVINAGDPAVTTFPEFDQRGDGFARVIGGRVDMGAVETRPALAATGGTVSPWLLLAVLGALVVGGAAVVVARRRRA